MSRETDSPSSGPNGRGGAAYPSGTPPYGTPQVSDGGPDAGRSGAQPEERKTETTLTTRIRINIPGSRPIPPVVVRQPVGETDGSVDKGADTEASAPSSSSTTGTVELPAEPAPPAEEKASDWFAPRKSGPAKGGPGGGASNGAGLPGGSGAAPGSGGPGGAGGAGAAGPRHGGSGAAASGGARPGGRPGGVVGSMSMPGGSRSGGTNGAGLPGATGGPVAPGHGGGTGSFDVTEALNAGPLGPGQRGQEPRRDDLPYFAENGNGTAGPNGENGQGGFGGQAGQDALNGQGGFGGPGGQDGFGGQAGQDPLNAQGGFGGQGGPGGQGSQNGQSGFGTQGGSGGPGGQNGGIDYGGQGGQIDYGGGFGGPQGPAGPGGSQGPAGPTGGPVTGDGPVVPPAGPDPFAGAESFGGESFTGSDGFGGQGGPGGGQGGQVGPAGQGAPNAQRGPGGSRGPGGPRGRSGPGASGGPGGPGTAATPGTPGLSGAPAGAGGPATLGGPGTPGRPGGTPTLGGAPGAGPGLGAGPGAGLGPGGGLSDDTAILTPQKPAPGPGAPGFGNPDNVSGHTVTSGIPVVPPGTQGPGGADARPAPKAPDTASQGTSAGSSKKKKKKGRSKLAMVGGTVVLLGVCAYGAGLLMNRSDVPKGTTVLGVDIGGGTRDDAVKKLDDALGKRVNEPLKLSVGGDTVSLRPDQAGLQLDDQATVAAAAKSDYNPVSVIGSLFGNHRVVDPVMPVDEEKLQAALENASGGAGSATDGTIKFQNGKAVAVYGKAGKGIDVARSTTAVEEAYRTQVETGTAGAVTLPTTTKEPSVSNAEVDRMMKEFAEPAMSERVTIKTDATHSIDFGSVSLPKILGFKAVGGKLVETYNLEALKEAYGTTFDGVQINGASGKRDVLPQDVASALGKALRGKTPADRIVVIDTNPS